MEIGEEKKFVIDIKVSFQAILSVAIPYYHTNVSISTTKISCRFVFGLVLKHIAQKKLRCYIQHGLYRGTLLLIWIFTWNRFKIDSEIPFSKNLYHTETNQWTCIDRLPYDANLNPKKISLRHKIVKWLQSN